MLLGGGGGQGQGGHPEQQTEVRDHPGQLRQEVQERADTQHFPHI